MIHSHHLRRITYYVRGEPLTSHVDFVKYDKIDTHIDDVCKSNDIVYISIGTPTMLDSDITDWIDTIIYPHADDHTSYTP